MDLAHALEHGLRRWFEFLYVFVSDRIRPGFYFLMRWLLAESLDDVTRKLSCPLGSFAYSTAHTLSKRVNHRAASRGSCNLLDSLTRRSIYPRSFQLRVRGHVINVVCILSFCLRVRIT